MEIRIGLRALRGQPLILWLLLSSCTRVGVTPSSHPVTLATHPLAVAKHNQVAVLSADYVAQYGEVTVVNVSEPDPSRQKTKAQYPVGGDPFLRWVPEIQLLFVVNRQGGENIQTFQVPSLRAAIPQYSMVAAEALGLTPNLQDISVKVVGGAAFSYVSALNSTQLLKTDGITNRVLNRIDLSPFADEDGLPEMALMNWVNDRLWITLQRMYRGRDLRLIPWVTTDHSSIVVIDPVKDNIVTEIRLAGKDPISNLKRGPDGRVYVSSWGGMSPNSGGGIESIDAVSGKSLGMVVDESSLGGKPFDFDFGANAVWVLLNMPNQHTQLVRLDWPSFANQEVVREADDKNRLQSVLFDQDRGLVFVASRDQRESGISILNAKGFDEVCFFSVGAPPLQLVWLGETN